MISFILFILSTVQSIQIVDDYEMFKSTYGSRFHVDSVYPHEVEYSEYCIIEENKSFDSSLSTMKKLHFPEKLWLAMIHTVPSKLSHVINTRNTWCQQQLQEKYGFKCIFIFVESTVNQSDKREEILRMNETYHDIHFITMPYLREQWFTLQQKNINAYIMAKQLFPGYYFYSRVDDEIIVTVDKLSTFLLQYLDEPTVIGEIISHRPNRIPSNKYYDPLAKQFPKYFPFPAGYLSLFSNDIIQYIAQWDNYYTFAPSSLEDPGFGHWIYKYAKSNKVRVRIVSPERWGGNVKDFNEDYIVYHSQRGKLNQMQIFQQQINRGYMS